MPTTLLFWAVNLIQIALNAPYLKATKCQDLKQLLLKRIPYKIIIHDNNYFSKTSHQVVLQSLLCLHTSKQSLSSFIFAEEILEAIKSVRVVLLSAGTAAFAEHLLFDGWTLGSFDTAQATCVCMLALCILNESL